MSKVRLYTSLAMKSLLLSILALLASAAAVAGADTVTVVFSVSDKSGHAVPGLTERDFSFYVDGRQRPISKVADVSTVPLRLVVLIDMSGSTQSVRIGSRELVDFFQLFIRRGIDNAAVAGFASSFTVFQDFTDDAALLGAAAEKAEKSPAAGGTQLYDSVRLAAKALASSPQRKAVVVVTDGQDTASRYSREEMRKELADNGILLYALSTKRLPEARRDIFDNAGPKFFQDARDLGGIIIAPSYRKDVAGAFEKIAIDLRSLYVLSSEFVTDSKSPGEPRKVRITSSRKDVTLRYPVTAPVR